MPDLDKKMSPIRHHVSILYNDNLCKYQSRETYLNQFLLLQAIRLENVKTTSIQNEITNKALVGTWK